MSAPRASAVIAAAGSGLRLGAGGPKALVELCGRPMIEWSLAALDAAETIGSIVIAAPPGHEGEMEAAGRAARTPVVVVSGGATRAESVRLALEAVRGELVAIHDAARPLIDPPLVDRVLGRLDASPEVDGVIAAALLTDTVKRAGEGEVIAGTLDRSRLWAAQTPQAFRTEALRRAQASAVDAGELESATDEAWLIERTGGAVLLEAAGTVNLKITTAADLKAAAALLAPVSGVGR